MLLFSLTLLQAGGACLLTGLLLWAMLGLAQRRWPELAAQRSVWLGALLVLAAAFVLPLLPDSRQLSVVPELAVPMALDSLAPGSLGAGGPEAMPHAASQPAAVVGMAWLALVPVGWVLVYLLGLFYAAWRWRRGAAMLRALLKLAQPRQLPGAGTLKVLEVDAPISPMLVGAWRPCLLLPAHLSQFTPEQQQLVIDHELTHARRRDPLLLLVATVLQALLWFNPAARWLVGRLAWAQELGCDRQVLAGRPRQQHQQYAAALVRQLGLQMQSLPGLAFGGSKAGLRERLLRLRGKQPAATPALRMLAILMLCVTGAASLALQPALAWTVAAPAVLPEPAGQPAAPPQAWRNPLATMRVLAFFGVVRPTNLGGVSGLDLAAKRGTPVHATADGIATATEDARLGKTVRIDHGGGWQSWYVHLDRVDVNDGDVVASGQVIGTVGDTGFATGPHLHFQVWHNGQLRDPQNLLHGLDANASARALRMRREQFGR